MKQTSRNYAKICGLTPAAPKDICLMSEDVTLDMDCFLNDAELDDDFVKKVFISSKPIFVCCARLCGVLSIQEAAAVFSIV